MSTPPPSFPRFVPTLTEVVAPSFLALDVDGNVSDHLNANEPLINSLINQLSVVIERRINDFGEELIRNLVLEQVQKVTSHLKLEIEATVRQAVHARHSVKFDQNKQK